MNDTGTSNMESRTGMLGTDAGGTLVVRRVRVRVVSGEDTGREAMLECGTLTLGSHPGADLVLSDRSVSRYHAELALLPEGIRVRDLDSTNGTFVGSARVESVVLVPAVEIKVGRTRIELLPADVPAADVPSERTCFGQLVGSTSAMRKVFGVLERVAAVDVPVLIEGEPGVGKSAAARSLHEASPRAGATFCVLDLGGMLGAPALMQAFTDCAGGTLVLDRVDEASAPLAAAAVAALEARERGELDVRVVATSRSDLRARVEAGAAPRDLYFHVAAVRVVIPPLRDRIDDLPRLVRALTSALGYDLALTPVDLAPLRAHDFPGNVRELLRVIEQTLVRSGRASQPPPPPAAHGLSDDLSRAPFKQAKEQLVEAFEREYVARLLARHDGKVSRAAQAAGLDRNYLTRLAKKHGLR